MTKNTAATKYSTGTKLFHSPLQGREVKPKTKRNVLHTVHQIEKGCKSPSLSTLHSTENTC